MDEARRIISQPFPQDRRELGFELAERSDIRRNISSLQAVWAAHGIGTAATK
jgi:hypothetical protein